MFYTYNLPWYFSSSSTTYVCSSVFFLKLEQVNKNRFKKKSYPNLLHVQKYSGFWLAVKVSSCQGILFVLMYVLTVLSKLYAIPWAFDADIVNQSLCVIFFFLIIPLILKTKCQLLKNDICTVVMCTVWTVFILAFILNVHKTDCGVSASGCLWAAAVQTYVR